MKVKPYVVHLLWVMATLSIVGHYKTENGIQNDTKVRNIAQTDNSQWMH